MSRLCECRKKHCAMCEASDLAADLLEPRVIVKVCDLDAIVKGVRPMLVRAFTAQAWATACAIEAGGAESTDITGSAWRGANLVGNHVAALPAPADLVAELYGTLP